MITRRTAEVGLATLTTLFGLTAMIGASEYGIGWSPSGPQPGTFPFAIGLLIVLASRRQRADGVAAEGRARSGRGRVRDP